MNGETRRTFFFGMPERLGEVADAPGDHLVRRPQREVVAVPRRDRRVRLHHRVRLVGRRVGRVELHRRGGERGVEVADLASSGGPLSGVCFGGCAASFSAARSNWPARRRVRRSCSSMRRVARLLEGLGDDDRDGLVVVLDVRAAEQLRGVRTRPCRACRRCRAVTIASTPGAACAARGSIDDDAALGDRRADDHAVGRVRHGVVALVRVRRGAGGLQRRRRCGRSACRRP